MAVIYKRVDKAIPRSLRTQVFSDDDAAVGDVLDFETTLGKPARLTSINAIGGDMYVRLNCITEVFNPRPLGFDDLLWTDGLPNLTSGHTFINSGITPIGISGNSTLVFDDLSIKNLQIVSANVHWKILVY